MFYYYYDYYDYYDYYYYYYYYYFYLPNTARCPTSWPVGYFDYRICCISHTYIYPVQMLFAQ